MKPSTAKLAIGLVMISWLLLMSCGLSPNSSDPNTGTITIRLKSVSSGAANFAKTAAVQTVSHVTITSAHVVIEKIRFDSSIDDTLDFRFQEPFVQDLLTGSDVIEIETVQVPFGNYKKSKIKIADLSPKDGAAFTQNPELQNKSILVKGFVNGDPIQTFIFSSDLDEEQEREFEPPLILDENSPSTNVVLIINLAAWFIDENNLPLDPRFESHRSAIENSIKNSIDIFEDADGDGEDDDGDDD